jgi:hypothetical protein
MDMAGARTYKAAAAELVQRGAHPRALGSRGAGPAPGAYFRNSHPGGFSHGGPAPPRANPREAGATPEGRWPKLL